MVRFFDGFSKLLIWIIAISIFLGYFNSWQLYCSHSMSWRYYFTLCSVTSIAEGTVAFVFIALSINSSLYKIAAYLILVLMLLVILEWTRVGEMARAIESYSWKLLGVLIGFILSKDWFNWRNHIIVFFLFLFMGIFLREEIDRGIVKLFLWLISFIITALLINQIRRNISS